MSDDQNSARVKATAQLIVDDNARAAASGSGTIPDDEVIVEPKPDEYLCPSYLHKTAPRLAPAFGELLGLLRDLNSRFVGQRTVDVQAILSLSGEHEWLEEKFFGWCRMYFEIRGSLNRLNPQNGNNPWKLYQDCCEEFIQLIENRLVQPGTINSSVLNLSQRYMQSAFADKVLGPALKDWTETGRDRYDSGVNRQEAISRLRDWHEAVRSFAGFLQQIAEHLPQRYGPNDAPEWLAAVQTNIAHQAEDLTFLRSVLYDHYPESQQLTPGLQVRLVWDVYHGRSVAAVLTSTSRQPPNEWTTAYPLAIRRDGWLSHREYSWLRVQPDYLPDERRAEFAVNWYVLDTLTAPLYEMWDWIDSDSVVSRGSEADATEEEQTAAIAVALAKIDAVEAPTPVVREKKSVPRLRLSEFEKITTEHFQCNWSPAKGSERKVFRHRGKQFTFGRHGIDRQVFPEQIKNCLRALGIPLADFVAVCR